MSCLKDKILTSLFLFTRQAHKGTKLGQFRDYPPQYCRVERRRSGMCRQEEEKSCGQDGRQDGMTAAKRRRNEEEDSVAGQDGITPGWTPVRRALNARLLLRWESDGHSVRFSTARRHSGVDVCGHPRPFKDTWAVLPYPGLSDGHFNPSIARLRHPVRGFNQGIGFSVITDLDDGGIYAL